MVRDQLPSMADISQGHGGGNRPSEPYDLLTTSGISSTISFPAMVVGGDVARMYLLGKNMNDQHEIRQHVFLERYTVACRIDRIGDHRCGN